MVRVKFVVALVEVIIGYIMLYVAIKLTFGWENSGWVALLVTFVIVGIIGLIRLRGYKTVTGIVAKGGASTTERDSNTGLTYYERQLFVVETDEGESLTVIVCTGSLNREAFSGMMKALNSGLEVKIQLAGWSPLTDPVEGKVRANEKYPIVRSVNSTKKLTGQQLT